MINRTFKDIYSNVGSNVQDTSTNLQPIVKRYINDAYADILRRVDFRMVEDDYSLTTSDQDNVLPYNFGKEIVVLDTTGNKELVYTDTQKYIKDYPTLAYVAGEVTAYDIIERGYITKPSATSTLSVVSSSGSDAGGTILIRGISDSVEIVEELTTTGTTPVVTSNSYSKVTSFSKSGVTVGKFTITSGSDTLAVIPPQIVDYKVKILKLFQSPVSSITLQIPYNVEPQPLYNDYDVPLIDIADIIEMGATAKVLRYKRQYQKANQMDMQFEKLIVMYIFDKERNPNRNHFINVTAYSRETV